MKIATEQGKYTNPRKTRRLTARERRGLEMIQGCRTAQPVQEGRHR